MKKLVALFMMILMILNICACKRVPEDTEGVSLPASSDTDSLEDNDEIGDSTKSFDETKTKTDKSNKHDIYDDISKPSDQKNVNKNTSNKADPCNLTIDNTFSEYAVVATLTNEESVKNKKYTPDDFPGISVFHVFERPDYYSLKYYPEYEGKTTLFMLLNNPSKQTVIDYIKILENDPRVYSAYVDVSRIYESLIYVKFADTTQLDKYTADDFSDLSIKKIDINLTSAQFILENNGTDSVFNTLKKR